MILYYIYVIYQRCYSLNPLLSPSLVPHFRRRLLINHEEHPMLIAEPSINTVQHREKYVHIRHELCYMKNLYLIMYFLYFLSMCDIFMFVQLSNNTLFIYYIFTCTYMSIFTRTCVSHHALLLVKRKGWSLFPNWGGLSSFLTAAAMIPDWGGCNSSSVLLPHTSCLGCGSSTT
jgi:hypothetical protein